MKRGWIRVLALLWPLTVALSGGCEGGFVTEAARSSLASFVNQVFTTAVNETIDP